MISFEIKIKIYDWHHLLKVFQYWINWRGKYLIKKHFKNPFNSFFELSLFNKPYLSIKIRVEKMWIYVWPLKLISQFLLSICDIGFFNFYDRQVQKSKFWNSLSETEILQSNFVITNSESKSQWIILQMNVSEWLYQENFVSFVEYHKLS